MRWRYGFGAFLLSVMLAGCAGEPQAERAIEGALPRLVGPADSYQVHITGLQGTRQAKQVEATGTRVRPAGAPVIDRVTATLQGVAYDPNRREVERVEQAEITARVLAPDIAAFLESRRNLKDASVSLTPPDRATVRARPEITGFNLPPAVAVTVTGRLVGEGSQVRYQVETVQAAGVTLPDGAPRVLSDAINPLVDLAAMPVVLRVTDAGVEGDAVVLRATGSYPAR